MHLRCYAKINPYLEITGVRNDGYHDLSILFRPVSLYDELYVDFSEGEGLTLTCSVEEFAGEDNIIYKAYNALKERFPQLPALKAHLIKNIPSGAGMGGGSSDAAAFLKAANILGDLGLTLDELVEIGAGIGADVPACLYKCPTYGEGIGEKLKAVTDLPDEYYIVIKPVASFNTGLMYRKYDELFKEHEISTRKHFNIFEKVVPEKKLIQNLKKALRQLDATWALMTGSGSCVVGAFSDKRERDRAFKSLSKLLDKGGIMPDIDSEHILNIYSCDSVLEGNNELHYVYIMKCSDGSLYTGWTTDIDSREKAHNGGKTGAKYTKAHGGGEIIYFEMYDNKSDALKREYDIKQLSRHEKLKLIDNN